VAKIDGYIIEVKGAEASVGHKRLVRIDEVGRTSAIAVPVDDEPLEDLPGAVEPEPVAAEATSEDEVESSGRRRGRRGGRRAQPKVAAATPSESSPE
jgi:ribonuclease G